MKQHGWPLTVALLVAVIGIMGATIRSQAKTIHDWRPLLWAENEQLQLMLGSEGKDYRMTEDDYRMMVKTVEDVRTWLASRDFHPEAMPQGAGSEKGAFQR